MTAALSFGDTAAPAIVSPLFLSPRASDRARQGRSEDGSLLLRQLGVVREMLAAMPQLSHAGQCATMAKVVRFITDQVDGTPRTMAGLTRHALVTLAEQLAREAQRLCPDIGAFADRVEDVIALLAATA
jgi:hypothetical protein